MRRNSGARAGDAIVLGKPLGVGVYGAALKRGALSDDGYRAMLDSTLRLNTTGIVLAAMDDVHALTDVTGFGLLGHLLEMCRGASVGAEIAFESVPLHLGVLELVRSGFVTGASKRNWESYGTDVDLSASIDDAARVLLTDPQTSGGLLVACRPAAVDAVLDAFRRDGFSGAAVIGTFCAGTPTIRVG
jgi:selenide,water dikinase